MTDSNSDKKGNEIINLNQNIKNDGDVITIIFMMVITLLKSLLKLGYVRNILRIIS